MKIHVGCSGFPVSRERYFARFQTVEIASTFLQLPRPTTVARWQADFPKDIQLAVAAWGPVTHPCTNAWVAKVRPAIDRARMLRYGHFRSTGEVRAAWSRFEKGVVQPLAPKFIVFRTPSTFYPNADHLRDMYRFFKEVRRDRALLVWEPESKSWDDRLIGKVCADLGLVHGVDPLARKGLSGVVHFYRLSGQTRYDRTHQFSESELSAVLSRCSGKPSYVFFENRAMWKDAQRFHAGADPIAARLYEAGEGSRKRGSGAAARRWGAAAALRWEKR